MAQQFELETAATNTNVYAEAKPELTTADVIILGEDNVEQQTPTQEQVERYVGKELSLVDSWLQLKVKNELVVQLYRGLENVDFEIDTKAVGDVISSELTHEREKNLDQALHVHTLIPYAAINAETPNGPDEYGHRDVQNLQRRIDVHHNVIDHIKAIEATGEDGLKELAVNYIEQTKDQARNEVIGVLMQQKKELEVSDQTNTLRIKQLEAALEQANEQILDRDMQLLDQELTIHAAHIDLDQT
jgi:hypothetical protein